MGLGELNFDLGFINYELQLLKGEKSSLLDYVDKVIPEDNWEQKTIDIKENEVDTFVMGSDWEGKFDDLNEYCKVIYFPRTEGISTTKLKAILKK